MAANRKYAALPDLDSAPDIYETPELTDDNSTIPPTTVRSPSDNGDGEDEDESGKISRSRLRIDEARSVFMSSGVDAREVDFSERLDSKRKSYKVFRRRQRILDDGTEEIGDHSDEDDAESLDRKLARLRLEIEEAKEEYEKRKELASKGVDDIAAHDEAMETLSRTLDEISRFERGLASPVAAAPNLARTAPEPERHFQEALGSATYTITYAPTYEQTHALAKVADFDQRLTGLEKALGVGTSAVPELDWKGLPRAVIPTLEVLQKQVSALSEASVTSLDSISRRVRTLKQETEALEKSRRSAMAAQEALAASQGLPAAENSAEYLELNSKINALYGTIPTIESLTPLLPPLMDRLRSLRLIHADAAMAAETLARLETRQAEMSSDIKQWKEGLEKVEAALNAGQAAMAGNKDVIEGWVNRLEERLSKLP